MNASAAEMGVLTALSRLPYLLFGLPAGVWVDRLSRRRLLMICSAGQAVTLSVIPVTAFAGTLSLSLLYIVAFVAGTLAVFADIASLSLVPTVLPAEHLTRGQSAIETSQSLSQVAGPALAGWLVQVLSAPTAILADALSFLFSTATVAAIRVREDEAADQSARPSLWHQIAVGARAVFGNVILRYVTLCTSTHIFFFNAFIAVFVLYLSRELGFTPSLLGTALGVGAAGGLIGSTIAPWVVKRLGLGKTLACSIATAGAGSGLAAVANDSLWYSVVAVIASQLVMWFALQIYNVLQVTLRYELTAKEIHGRVNATIRTAVWGVAPVGALTGGLLGDLIGLRGTLVVSGIGAALASLWIIFSPVIGLSRAARSTCATGHRGHP